MKFVTFVIGAGVNFLGLALYFRGKAERGNERIFKEVRAPPGRPLVSRWRAHTRPACRRVAAVRCCTRVAGVAPLFVTSLGGCFAAAHRRAAAHRFCAAATAVVVVWRACVALAAVDAVRLTAGAPSLVLLLQLVCWSTYVRAFGVSWSSTSVLALSFAWQCLPEVAVVLPRCPRLS
jgi:hypothetical protein